MFEKQKLVDKFIKENNLEADFMVRTLDVISELGEVSKEILKGTDYGKTSLAINEKIIMEMGDLIFSTLALANSLEVNLDFALEKAIEKYKMRLRKGSPGSEND